MLLRADIVSSSRYFSFTPEAGQSYRWHLGTLLSLPFGKAGGEEKSTTPSDTIRGKEGGSDHE